MLLSAPPLEQTPPCPAPAKGLSATSTAEALELIDQHARTAPPPMRPPEDSQRLPVNVARSMRTRPL